MVLLLCLVVMGLPALSEDLTFRKSKVVDAWRQEYDADLLFLGGQKAVVLREKKSILLIVPFDDIVSVRYENSTHHRTPPPEAGGGGLGLAVYLPAALVIAATKTTDHLLYIGYKTAGIAQELRLKLDPAEYRSVLATVKSQTGKDVEIPLQKDKGGK